MRRAGRGDQVLRGAGWELFRDGLGSLRDMIGQAIDGPDEDLTGVAAFDRLQPSPKDEGLG